MLTISHDQTEETLMPHITHTVPQRHGFSKIRLQSMDTAAGNPGQLSISRPLPQCTAKNQNLLGPFVRFVMQILPLRATISRFYLPSTLTGSCEREVMPSYVGSSYVSIS